MKTPKLTKLESRILEALWERGNASIREIQEAFPEPRPAYTTIQTTVYRMETKGWIKAEWAQSDNNRKAKYYSLTKAGRKQLEAEQQNWDQLSTIIAEVMQNA